MHISIIFQKCSPFTLLHNTDRVQFCYTVWACWLSILNIAVCTCQSQIPYYPSPNLWLKFWHTSGSFYGESFQILGNFEFKLIHVSVTESMKVKWIGYFYMPQRYSQFGESHWRNSTEIPRIGLLRRLLRKDSKTTFFFSKTLYVLSKLEWCDMFLITGKKIGI